MKPFRDCSIRTKLVAGFSSLTFLLVAPVGAVAVNRVNRFLHAAQVEKGEALARALARTSSFAVATRNVLRDLEPLVSKMAEEKEVLFVAVVDHRGRVLASAGKNGAGAPIFLGGGVPKAPVFKTERGDYRFSYPVEPPPGTNVGLGLPQTGPIGTVELTVSAEAVRKNSRNAVLGILFFTVLQLLAGVVFAHYFTRPISRGIRRVSEAYADFERGLAVSVTPQGRDEIGDLANGFNRTTERVRQAQEGLERERNYVRSIIAAMVDTLLVLEPDGFIRSANEATGSLLGCPSGTLVGQALAVILSFEQEDQMATQAAAARVKALLAQIERKGFVRDMELVLKSQGGEAIPVVVNASALLDRTGATSGILMAARDLRLVVEVAAARASEEAMRRYSSQLQAKNQELETFSYSVSHDLRAPLRAMDGFSQALREDYGDKLDAQGLGYLDRIRAACARMGRLIDDLLALSRLARTQIRLEKVDLSALARSFEADLRGADPNRKVHVLIADGLMGEGDPVLLRVVIENLLGNSWKYTAKRSEATIELDACVRDGTMQFFVRDNGAGFDMSYADKLFRPFQRLHADSEFAGTGIGLASVQKIIGRHGGRVWAEGLVNQGSTVYFTLS